jgi:hypothetical protein
MKDKDIRLEVEALFDHLVRKRNLSPMTAVIVMAEVIRAIGHVKRNHDERDDDDETNENGSSRRWE